VPVSGQLSVGAHVLLDRPAYEGDPQTALHLPFEEVTFPSELGPLGAWQLPEPRSTWAIYTHGFRSSRQEALRFLPALVSVGLPTLVIQYRNDLGVAASVSGHYDFGLSEWRDLEAAARYALAHGAHDVVLFGISMGGGIAVSFLYHSTLADHVRAVVLDSPMLDLAAVVDLGGERSGQPPGLMLVGKLITAGRFGVDWRGLDYVSRASELHVPILLIHGDEDTQVPISTSEAFARARPDIVTFVRVAGASHAAASNSDPEAYDRILTDFLRKSID